MAEIRDFSKARFKSAHSNTQFSSTADMDDHTHAYIGNGKYDLDLARTPEERAFLGRVCSDPMRQNIGERIQNEELMSVFPNYAPATKASIFLIKGKKLKRSERGREPDPHDIDATIQDELYEAVFNNKKVNVEGTAQSNQFRDVASMIEQAPINGNVWLVCYVSGDFWLTRHNQFLNYENTYDLANFNRVEVLKKIAEGRNVIIIDDTTLPTSRIRFDEFVANHLSSL